MMNEQELFVKINQVLTDVVNHVKDEQLDQVLPDDLTWRKGITLRRAVNICAYENRCVPEVLEGKEGLASNDEFTDDLLGNEPLANFNRYSDIANRAAMELADPGRIVHMSYGDAPAREYLRDITINRGLGAYDIAAFIGTDVRMPDDLVQGLMDSIAPMADMLRQHGVFGPEVEVPSDASPQAKLLGLTGRDPHRHQIGLK
jgi:uncharacterized protein (TIGR03086 family)